MRLCNAVTLHECAVQKVTQLLCSMNGPLVCLTLKSSVFQHAIQIHIKDIHNSVHCLLLKSAWVGGGGIMEATTESLRGSCVSSHNGGEDITYLLPTLGFTFTACLGILLGLDIISRREKNKINVKTWHYFDHRLKLIILQTHNSSILDIWTLFFKYIEALLPPPKKK